MRSKYELKTQKELQAQGFKTDYKIRPRINPRGYNVDYFNILAYKDGELKLIAVKGHENVPGELRRGIEEFKVTKVVKEIWVYRKNGTVKREVLA